MTPMQSKKAKAPDMTTSLPTDEIAIKNQLAILQIIVEASDSGSKWVTTEEIAAPAAALDCDQDRVARCIPFFESVQLVERQSPRGPLRPTSLAIQYMKDADSSKTLLREKLANTWFGISVTRALKAATQADEERLIKVLSKAGNLDTTKRRTRIKAKKLLEYLVFADHLAKDAKGKYMLK